MINWNVLIHQDISKHYILLRNEDKVYFKKCNNINIDFEKHTRVENGKIKNDQMPVISYNVNMTDENEKKLSYLFKQWRGDDNQHCLCTKRALIVFNHIPYLNDHTCAYCSVESIPSYLFNEGISDRVRKMYFKILVRIHIDDINKPFYFHDVNIDSIYKPFYLCPLNEIYDAYIHDDDVQFIKKRFDLTYID